MNHPTHLRFKLTYEGTIIGHILAPIDFSDYEHDILQDARISTLSVVIQGVTLRAMPTASDQEPEGATLHLTDMSIADTPIVNESLKSLKASLVCNGCTIISWLTDNEEISLQEAIIRNRNTDELLDRGRVNFLRKWNIKGGAFYSVAVGLVGAVASGYLIDASIGFAVFNTIVTAGLIAIFGQNYFVEAYAENHNANLIE